MKFGGGEGFLLYLFDLTETEPIHHALRALILFLLRFVAADSFFYRFVVVVVIALVEKHKRDIVLGVQEPVAEPRPKAIITIDGYYLLIVGRLGEQTAYLLSSAFFFVASSAACASAALHLFSVSLTPSPIGFIESAS